MSLLRRFSLSIIALLFVSTTVNAADCPEIVKNALDATDSACNTVGRNQACYGNINLTVEPLDAGAAFNFTKPGDLVEIGGVKKLVLSPLDASADTWGIALLKVQANLPDTLPGQNVSFVLFGDVQIENTVGTAATLSVTAQQLFNVRAQPSATAAVVSALQGGTELLADGITEDAAWLRVHTADSSVQGWVSASIVTVTGDIKTLAVVQADAPRYSPMQAFFFKSGLKDAPCSQAPDSGILIQTPEGAGKIQLNVDGANITLGSTAYFQAQPSGEMTVSVVEGQGTVTAAGTTVTVPAGMRARVPLDANLTANGAPIGPEPYDAAALGVLPLRLMPQVVTIAPAVAAGVGIKPLPGKWDFVITDATGSASCGVAITAGMFPKQVLTLAEGEFDLLTFMNSAGGQDATTIVVIDHPDPNQYIANATVDGGQTFTYEFNIVSDKEIQATGRGTAYDGCEVVMTVEITRQGD